MRFLFVIIIWFVFVGGLWGYMHRRDAGVQPRPEVVEQFVEGSFAIELTTTFDAEADPFALRTSDTKTSEIEIRLNGRQLVLPDKPVTRGSVVRLEDISGVLHGHNDIFISASPPISESMLEHGVRLKVFADGNLVADYTAWSGDGALVSDSYGFEYSPSGRGEDDHH